MLPTASVYAERTYCDCPALSVDSVLINLALPFPRPTYG